MLHVGVVTRHDDFHAQVMRRLLDEQGVRCSLLFADCMPLAGELSWSSAWPAGHQRERGRVRDAEGEAVFVDDLDLLWWRRLTGQPRIPAALSDANARQVVSN